MSEFWKAVGQQRLYVLLVFIAFGLGATIRLWDFPSVPPGVNVDEALSTYEAYSVAETGHDQWGTQLPAYFPAWGSGQSVLLAYLSIPVLKVFGLGLVSARLVSVVLGILSLPLFFYCLRPWGRYPALCGLLLLGLAPWHFMLSRWGLDCNIAPFWMLLGCITLSRAISNRQPRWIIPSLLPFAVALYAYGTTIMVLVAMLLLVFIVCFGRIRSQLSYWLLAGALFLLIATPFLLFFIENYVLHRNLAWTDHLFFSTPLLPATRLSQVGQGSWVDVFNKNISLALGGFDDATNYNQLPGFPLLLHFTWALASVGFVGLGYRLLRQRGRLADRPADVVGLLFLAWELGCLPFFFLFELNINRINHFFLPCMALAVWGAALIINNLREGISKPAIWGLLSGWLVIDGGLAAHNYFTEYPQGGINAQFNNGLAGAFEAVSQQWGLGQVRVTSQMPLPYIYTAFYLRYPPAQFQRDVQMDIVDGVYTVRKLGRYVFDDQYLEPGKPYVYLARKDEMKDDAQHHKTIVYSNELWEVGTIQPLAAGAPTP